MHLTFHFLVIAYNNGLFIFSPTKDNGEEPEILTDERILIPDLTIVEEDGSALGTDNMGQKESKSLVQNSITLVLILTI